MLVREIKLIRKLIEKSEAGFRLGVNSQENLSIDSSRTISDLIKVCNYVKHNHEKFDNSVQPANYEAELGEVEDLMAVSHISKKIPDAVVIEILTDNSENIRTSFLKRSQYEHYPKLIVNLFSEINLKSSSARSEMKNVSSKLAELYYLLEAKLQETKEVNYLFFKKTKDVLKKDARFSHRVEFLKLALIRKSIAGYLEEFELVDKYKKELLASKSEVRKDLVTFFEEKHFVLNKRPATPISPISYHFTDSYNNIPLSIIAELADELNKYSFYRLSPLDCKVKITESYDPDGLVEKYYLRLQNRSSSNEWFCSEN